MKTIIFALLLAVSAPTYAVIKCERTPTGSCCWDVNKEGPFRPITC